MDFFRLTVQSILLNLNPFMMDTIKMGSVDEMFYRAKYVDNVKFNNFHEWVSNDINKAIYNHDDYFKGLTQNHKEKLMKKRKNKMIRFYTSG